jgi:hypothetical protein
MEAIFGRAEEISVVARNYRNGPVEQFIYRGATP